MHYRENRRSQNVGGPKTKKARTDSGAGEGAVEQALNGATLKARVDQATKGRQSSGLIRNA